MANEVKLAAGETATTVFGWETTPFPRVAFDTNRKAAATLKRIEAWLIENARRAWADDPTRLAILDREIPGRLPPAVIDELNAVLFGF